MNLYNYLMEKSNNTTRAAEEAEEAYKRFRAHGRTLAPVKDCDPFVFAFIDHGYQAFTFRPEPKNLSAQRYQRGLSRYCGAGFMGK